MTATRRSFTRDGTFSIPLLTTLLVLLAGYGDTFGYACLLAKAWAEARLLGLKLRSQKAASAPAFTKARRKLKPAFFRTFHQHLVQALFGDAPAGITWKNHRLVAIDGSRFTLPRSPLLWKRFGGPTGSAWPQATVTLLYDALARVPVSAALDRFAADERAALKSWIGDLKPRDLVLADRGYASYEVIARLLAAGVGFVLRVQTQGTFSEVARFLGSAKTEEWITLRRPDDAPKDLEENLKVRVVRRQDRGRRCLVVLTSLPREEASAGKVLWLYKQRWNLEEEYKCWKARAKVSRQFHAQDPEGIEQEVWALVTHFTLARTVFVQASTRFGFDYRSIRLKEGLTRFAASLLVLALGTRRRAEKALKMLLQALTERPYRERPGRSYPRRSLAPSPKWGPRGRRSRRKYG